VEEIIDQRVSIRLGDILASSEYLASWYSRNRRKEEADIERIVDQRVSIRLGDIIISSEYLASWYSKGYRQGRGRFASSRCMSRLEILS
jgi:hypothetical protein